MACIASSGCASAPQPVEAATSQSAIETPPLVPDSVPVADPPAPEPAPEPTTVPLSATTAMPMEGTVDATALVSAVNEQLAPLAPCVGFIRETDHVVGSLNLQVSLAAGGQVTVDLQSPVNDRARACLEARMQSWIIRAGEGRAMLLLELRDLAMPP